MNKINGVFTGLHPRKIFRARAKEYLKRVKRLSDDRLRDWLVAKNVPADSWSRKKMISCFTKVVNGEFTKRAAELVKAHADDTAGWDDRFNQLVEKPVLFDFSDFQEESG